MAENDSNIVRNETYTGPFAQQVQQNEAIDPDDCEPQNYRRLRKGSDLLYADALIALSKRNEGG